MLLLLQLEMAGEHICMHFLSSGHERLADVRVIIIGKTSTDHPTQREAFGAYKLDTFV